MKEIHRYLEKRLSGINDIDKQRAIFEELVKEEDEHNISEFLLGKSIAKHVIYMAQNSEDITYPPIIEAIEIDGKLVPADNALNRGLFDALSARVSEKEIINPNDIIGSFVIGHTGSTVYLQDVPTMADLSPLECMGLKARIANAPFLRASYTPFD